MDKAAVLATTDIHGAYLILRSLPDHAPLFMRGMRHVRLAYLAQMKDGTRSNRVERMVRIGFRKIARYSMGMVH
jgi:hypothetical protein